MKKLSELVEILEKSNNLIESPNEDYDILDITFDSREVKKGSLFFCKGAAFKVDYLASAIMKGAVAYISEEKYDFDLPVILVKDIRRSMLDLARFFYDNPDTKLTTIGVTGTKGKSSTVTYLKSILDVYQQEKNEMPAGIISTINIYDGVEELDSSLSTPEALVLYKHLNNAVNAGLKYMIIESSSQAFKYNRINNVDFDIAMFLNIGEDHVSPTEHPSFEDYFASKLKIFDNAHFAMYNKESDHLDEIKSYILSKGIESKTFSVRDDSDLSLIKYNMTDNGNVMKFQYDQEEMSFEIKQVGSYNIENAMAAILIAKHLGVDNSSILEGLYFATIKGREYIFQSDDKKLVFLVSYAHNELSFDKSFEFIKEKYPGYKIACLYGNTGNMAISRIEGNSRSAGKNADYVYIVPDDSGKIEYHVIADRLAAELRRYTENFEILETREAAIRDAFDKAVANKEHTVIFAAGKGVEDYQKIGTERVKITSDYDIAKELLERYNLEI